MKVTSLTSNDASGGEGDVVNGDVVMDSSTHLSLDDNLPTHTQFTYHSITNVCACLNSMLSQTSYIVTIFCEIILIYLVL